FSIACDGFHPALVSACSKRRDAKIAALPDLARGCRVHDLGGELRQKLRGGNERLVQPIEASQLVQLFERMRLVDREIARGGPPQLVEDCAASKLLAEVMGDGSYIEAGAAMNEDSRCGVGGLDQFKRVHGDFNRFELDRDVLARQLVGRRAANLLRRNRRRSLQKNAAIRLERAVQLIAV